MRVTTCKCLSVLWVALSFGSAVLGTPPDGTDKDLRLWLRADDLTGAVGSEVTNWEDASIYGTIMAPPGPRIVGGNLNCPESPADRGPGSCRAGLLRGPRVLRVRLR